MVPSQITKITPIGCLYLAANEKGVCSASWSKSPSNKVLELSEISCRMTRSHLKIASQQVQEYFNGRRKKFELTLDFSGTDFQKEVWKELLKIPFGETRSYSDVASRVGRPKAVRAVGSANRRNPVGLFIPCHRVIAKDGSLAGYAGGLRIKEKLLHLEVELNH